MVRGMAWITGVLLVLGTTQAPCLAQTAPAAAPAQPESATQTACPAPVAVEGGGESQGLPTPPKSPTVNNASATSNNTADWLWSLLAETPPQLPRMTGGPGANFMPFMYADYKVTYMPDAPVSNQGGHYNSVRQELSAGIPVYKDECSMLGFMLGVRSELIDTNAVLPNSTVPFPHELWDVRFGLNYKYQFDNGWSAGGTVNVGSASDRPFGGIDEMTASVMGFLRIPVREHDAWIFSLSYSPTAELNFPIPGIAYMWVPDDTFNMMIGIPFKVWWRPLPDLTFEAGYMPLTNVTAKTTWHIWGGVFAYVSYAIENESYFLYDRTEYNERFFYYDQRVTGGIKLQFGRNAALDLASGFAFDRYAFEGVSVSSNQSSRVDIGDGAFLSLMFKWRF
jgi:hypothetical protein